MREKEKSFIKWASQEASEIFKSLDTAVDGLTGEEAENRLKDYGVNQIHSQRVYGWHILLRQFKSPFVYILVAAAILAFFLREIVDGLMIVLFVGINSALGFFQEYKSEQTAKLLQKYLVSKASVKRSGKTERVEITSLVPGDIVLLEPGDLVPADVRFIDSYDLTVDESVLSGESVPVAKFHTPFLQESDDLYKAKNIGFWGTIVTSGKATGVVVATGKNTVYGAIAELTGQTIRESSYEKQIRVFSKFTLGLVLATLALVICVSLVIKQSPSLSELVLFSLALAVSVIPEALPVVTTFSLSIGAARLAKKGVVVKRLAAIEDLGGIEILCSDKTGTLTENVLTVDAVYPEAEPEILTSAGLVSSPTDKERNQGNNAFDTAIEKEIEKRKLGKKVELSRLAEMPFDPERRRASVVVKRGGKFSLISRGAPEEILAVCSGISVGEKRLILQKIAENGKQGRRLLAVAGRELQDYRGEKICELEKQLKFLGLIAFADPIKSSTFEAVEQAKKLGIQIKILTGDSKEVAGNVAVRIGLIEKEDEVLTGGKFEALSVDKQRQAVVDFQVFSRVSPQQKYKIIKLLEEKSEVGFLGEGINDAPALKIANVALVVQDASDIAKEAADILLLKKSLKAIVDGIKEGRKVFANTAKYITTTLASNFGNFFAVAAASLMIDYLPMLPLQILLLNLLSDFPSIAIATDSVDPESLKIPSHYSLRSFASAALLFGIVSTLFDFIFFGTFVRVSSGVLQTSWFVGSILTEILFLFLVRSRRFFLKTKKPSTVLLVLTAAAFIVTVSLPYVYVGQRVFQFVPLTSMQLGLVFSIVAVYLATTELVKHFYYKYTKVLGLE